MRFPSCDCPIAFNWFDSLFFIYTNKNSRPKAAFLLVELRGIDLHFLPLGEENYGVAAIELAASNSPPDCCI